MTGWLVNMNPCCIEHQLIFSIGNELNRYVILGRKLVFIPIQGEPAAEQISGVRHYGCDIFITFEKLNDLNKKLRC